MSSPAALLCERCSRFATTFAGTVSTGEWLLWFHSLIPFTNITTNVATTIAVIAKKKTGNKVSIQKNIRLPPLIFFIVPQRISSCNLPVYKKFPLCSSNPIQLLFALLFHLPFSYNLLLYSPKSTKNPPQNLRRVLFSCLSRLLLPGRSRSHGRSHTGQPWR